MKRSRFFCEHCHKEVRPNARVCPHCGKFFEAVRCPACDYVGDGRDFVRGCPNCGYAGAAGGRSGLEPVNFGRSSSYKGEGTPSWVWPLAILMMMLAFGALVVIYLRM
jgi:hypothetical protein